MKKIKSCFLIVLLIMCGLFISCNDKKFREEQPFHEKKDRSYSLYLYDVENEKLSKLIDLKSCPQVMWRDDSEGFLYGDNLKDGLEKSHFYDVGKKSTSNESEEKNFYRNKTRCKWFNDKKELPDMEIEIGVNFINYDSAVQLEDVIFYSKLKKLCHREEWVYKSDYYTLVGEDTKNFAAKLEFNEKKYEEDLARLNKEYYFGHEVEYTEEKLNTYMYDFNTNEEMLISDFNCAYMDISPDGKYVVMIRGDWYIPMC